MQRNIMKNQSSKTGFTLLELLIVVAIIGLLAAILFPVFARVRENARRSTCQSNLKQIGLGVQMYTQDYDERYPQAGYTDTSYSDANPPPGGWVSDYSRGTKGVAWHNLIEPYTKNQQIFACPSTPKLTTKNGIKNLAEGQVGINLALIQRRNFWNDSTPNSLSRVASPAEKYVVFDCGTNILNPSEAASPGGSNENNYLPGAKSYADSDIKSSAPAYKQNDFQSGRHFGGVNMLFADGHVKWLKSELVVAEAKKYTTAKFGWGFHPVQHTAWDPWFDNE